MGRVIRAACPYAHLLFLASMHAGKPLFGTLISLLHKGRPILGIIDQPILRCETAAHKALILPISEVLSPLFPDQLDKELPVLGIIKLKNSGTCIGFNY